MGMEADKVILCWFLYLLIIRLVGLLQASHQGSRCIYEFISVLNLKKIKWDK